MHQRFPILLFVLCLMASLTHPAQAQQNEAPATPAAPVIPQKLPDHAPSLQLMSVQAFKTGDYKNFVRVLEKAHDLRPYDAQIMAQLVAGYALLDNKPSAYTMMLKMQKQGLSYDFDHIPQIENIRSTQVYQHINGLLKMAANPYGYAETAFTLPADMTMPEAIAWDPFHEQFIVGTVRDGLLKRFLPNGEPDSQFPAFEQDKLWAVFGIAVNDDDDTVWVSSTAIGQWAPYKSSDYGLSGLFEFDLVSGELKKIHRLTPDGKPHGMGNIALSWDGSVFVADNRLPMVHVLRHGGGDFETLFISQDLTSLRGLAFDDDKRILYVADRELGIAYWSEKDQQLYRMVTPEDLNLGGIDGLHLWQGHLIVIQNGIQPARVMQLRLSADGRGIADSAPLVAAQEAFDGPSFGAVVENEFYFFGANHWPAYDVNGDRLAGTKVDPVPVLKLPLAPLSTQSEATVP